MQGLKKRDSEGVYIQISGCQNTHQVVEIHKYYRKIAPETALLFVDLSRLNPMKPDALLLGVLLNLRRHFSPGSDIQLHFYPGYLPLLLNACRVGHLFTLRNG